MPLSNFKSERVFDREVGTGHPCLPFLPLSKFKSTFTVKVYLKRLAQKATLHGPDWLRVAKQ